MENFMKKNEKKIEGFIIIVYSLYVLTMVYISKQQEWAPWVANVMVVCLVADWIMVLGKYKTYHFRSYFSAIMMQISVILYVVNQEDFSRAIPVFLAFVVFSGLFGNEKIVRITAFSTMGLFGLQCWKVIERGDVSTENFMLNVSQMVNILLLVYVVYVWSKENRMGSSALLKTIEELKVAQHSKDDFLANVSHEIRTPINTINGMTELIRREELPYGIKEYFLNIQNAGQNLKAVVSDILDYSELQSGELELEEEVYQIATTVQDVVNMAMARKGDKNIEVIVNCGADIPRELLGDEKKLRRVIMNLVDNAIKFTEKGCIAISIGCRKEDYGVNLVVTVKDTGIGIDKENLEKLFVAFGQLDASRKRQEGGVGLGLAISRALIRKMGGAITVKSGIGEGSIVKFVIPQKVVDETPVARIYEKESVNVAFCIDMENIDQSSIRGEYVDNIVYTAGQLNCKNRICRNLLELQRRAEKEVFSHVFVGIKEYRENPEYFSRMAKLTRVFVILDYAEEKYINHANIGKVFKPFHMLSVADAINRSKVDKAGVTYKENDRLTTVGAHVLVVDDNRMNLKVAEGLLATYGIKVTLATSGKEALEKITSMEYDFVFMDHMMPEMDGVETFHHIRSKVGSYYQKVPVVALTANAVAGTRDIFMGEGFSDFVEKPIEKSVLERVLKRILPKEKIVTIAEHNFPGTEQEKTGGELDFGIEGLDVEKGMLYCNGKDQYIKILKGYCQDGEDTGKIANQLFEKQDWKNYTITVHGMKSAMRSIGAIQLSDLAKELEFAGKEGHIDFIRQHHKRLIQEYERVVAGLRKVPLLCPEESVQEDIPDQVLQPISSEEFERTIVEMEDAMFALDGERLMELVSGLQQYSYCGKRMADFLTPVKRKIEMSDYVSAVDLLVRLQEEMADKEEMQ